MLDFHVVALGVVADRGLNEEARRAIGHAVDELQIQRGVFLCVKRVPEARALEHRQAHDLHHACEGIVDVARDALGVPELQRLDVICDVVVQHGAGDGVFVRKVVVEKRASHLAALADVLDRGLGKPLLFIELAGCIDDHLLALVAHRPSPLYCSAAPDRAL